MPKDNRLRNSLIFLSFIFIECMFPYGEFCDDNLRDRSARDASVKWLSWEARIAWRLGREIPGSQELSASPADRKGKDRLLIAILSTASFLAILIWGTMLIWGTGPVLTSVPWYIPLVSSFISLIAFLVGYLALGRYQVLRDPVSFWVGSGYLVYGLGQIFYAFSWPGLLPDGEAILGQLPSTSAWITLVSLTLLEVFLLAAVLNSWPNRFSLPGNQWLKPVLTFLLVAILFFGIIHSPGKFSACTGGWQWHVHAHSKRLGRRSIVFFCAGQHLFHPLLSALTGPAGWFYCFSANGPGVCLHDGAHWGKTI